MLETGTAMQHRPSPPPPPSRSHNSSTSSKLSNDPDQPPHQPSLARRSPSDGPGGEEEPPLIELVNVSKSFGSKQILRDASITIRRGEAVGIIGGSGTGKSTTLRLMAGLLAPDSGEVRIAGVPRRGLLSDDPAADGRVRVGLVFQSGALFDSLTVGENVGFLLYEHSDLPEARVKAAVADALASVGLSGVEGLYPAELSGGMRKRVALARAIVRDRGGGGGLGGGGGAAAGRGNGGRKEGGGGAAAAAAGPGSSAAAAAAAAPSSPPPPPPPPRDQVIMYDEPTAGLDPVASTVIEDLIRSLGPKKRRKSKKETNSPTFFGGDGDGDLDDGGGGGGDPDSPAVCAAHIVVTHQHSTIRRAVDRLVFLHQGSVAWEGTVEEFDASDAPIVRQFREGRLDGPIKYE